MGWWGHRVFACAALGCASSGPAAASRGGSRGAMSHGEVEAPPVEEKGLAAGILVEEAAASSESAGASRPKGIVLSVIDDWGYGDVSYHDSAMHTPELASWAASGIVLEQFYAACTCTPSRAMLLTGRYNVRNGMQDSVLHSTEPRGLPLSERLLPQKLRESGYATAGVGKWHLGMVRSAYLPERRGFERWYGIYTGGGSHTGHFSVSQPFTVRGEFGSSEAKSWQGFNLWENLEPSADNYGTTHSTKLYTRKAVEYVEAMRAEASHWFLYLAYQAVHDPIAVGDEAYVSATPCRNATAPPEVSASNRPTLCGMVAEVDDGLKTLRLAVGEDWAETLAVVVSDNGGVKAHGSSNAPLRGEKGTYYEGGVRVPAILSGGFLAAALARANRRPHVSYSLSHLVDLHATILDLADYDSTDDKPGDGVSLWPHLVDAADPPRDDLLVNLNSDLFGGSGALRSGRFKLVVNPEPNEAALYSKVRKALAANTAEVPADVFANILAEAHAQVLGEPRRCLFDLDANPTETDDPDCDDAPACSNLYDNPRFADVRDRLRDTWARYQRDAAPSTFAWEDDGPLADPDLFGGVWSPWRDADNQPKAHYLGFSNPPADAAAASSLAAAAAADPIPALFPSLALALLSFCLGAFVSARLAAAWASPWHRLP